MKRFRRLRMSAVPALLAGAVIAAGPPAPAAALVRTTGDIVERFSADPLGDSRWFASGSWTWEVQGSTLLSDGPASSLLWTPGSHFTGTVGLRFRLGGAQSQARLLFAHDPATGAHRWVEVAGGPGRVTLGQTGAIGGSAAGVIQVWRTPVAVGSWQVLEAKIAGDKTVTVSLGGVRLFTAAAAPLAQGLVGFGSAGGPVAFDEFSFTADPDGEPCSECHAGQPGQPLAANVYEWWDGRRWDALHGGDPADQEGGHGDPGGAEFQQPALPPVACTGINGCHDLRQPRPEDHRNGFREGRGRRTANSFHLRISAIVTAPQNAWDAQVTLDDFCYLQCHAKLGLANDRHAKGTDPNDPTTLAVSFGQGRTRASGETLALPVDSDLTTRATETNPDFAPCVSCHDPHGTGVTDNKGNRNVMLRLDWYTSSTLCNVCHV